MDSIYSLASRNISEEGPCTLADTNKEKEQNKCGVTKSNPPPRTVSKNSSNFTVANKIQNFHPIRCTLCISLLQQDLWRQRPLDHHYYILQLCLLDQHCIWSPYINKRHGALTGFAFCHLSFSMYFQIQGVQWQSHRC